MIDPAAGLALAAAAFLSATILPGGSEALLAGLVASGAGDPVALVVLAGAANTLGSVVNWVLGRFLLGFSDRRWFPVGKDRLERASAAFKRHGLLALPFAWVPVVGDPLTVAAGMARVPLGTLSWSARASSRATHSSRVWRAPGRGARGCHGPWIGAQEVIFSVLMRLAMSSKISWSFEASGAS